MFNLILERRQRLKLTIIKPTLKWTKKTIQTEAESLNKLLLVSHDYSYMYLMTSLLRNLGMETGNESVSSFFDDSSHSESNAKEDVCDGDDELTDFEGNDS